MGLGPGAGRAHLFCLFRLILVSTLQHQASSNAGPQEWSAQTCHRMLSFGTQVSHILAVCGLPGRNRREPVQMEEGFRQSLVLGERGGVIALLLHLELLQ